MSADSRTGCASCAAPSRTSRTIARASGRRAPATSPTWRSRVIESDEFGAAVACDARQQVGFPREIIRHRLLHAIRALIGLEPGIDRLVGHARIVPRQRKT